jgi:hypothetical protein
MLKALAVLYLIAAGQTECASVDKVKADMRALAQAIVIIEMGGTEASAFVTALNAIPPRTSWEADYIVTAQMEGKPGVAIILFNRGCATTPFGIPVHVFKKLRESL